MAPPAFRVSLSVIVGLIAVAGFYCGSRVTDHARDAAWHTQREQDRCERVCSSVNSQCYAALDDGSARCANNMFFPSKDGVLTVTVEQQCQGACAPLPLRQVVEYGLCLCEGVDILRVPRCYQP